VRPRRCWRLTSSRARDKYPDRTGEGCTWRGHEPGGAIRLHTEEVRAAVRENVSLFQELRGVVRHTREALQIAVDEVQELAVETSRTGMLAEEVGGPAQKVLRAATEQSALLEKVIVTLNACGLWQSTSARW